MKQLIFTLFIASTIIGCKPSTKIVKSWQEPGATITQNTGNKTLVIAMVRNEPTRLTIEDELIKRLKGTGVASYTLMSPDSLQRATKETLVKVVEEGRFTHVLMMRLADVKKETSYVPGTTTIYYSDYGSYFEVGTGTYTTPGYYSTDKSFFIETTVFSVSPNKLLWTGTTNTINPTSMDKVVNEIADAVAAKMKKEGFLK